MLIFVNATSFIRRTYLAEYWTVEATAITVVDIVVVNQPTSTCSEA
jgi:hypothetical protein